MSGGTSAPGAWLDARRAVEAVVRRETSSLRWPAFLFAYMGVLAWVTSFGVFQLGKLLGLG